MLSVSDLTYRIFNICSELAMVDQEFYQKLYSAIYRVQKKPDFEEKLIKFIKKYVLFPSTNDEHIDRIKKEIATYKAGYTWTYEDMT